MLSIHLICVGKLKEKFYQQAAAEYEKRLSAYCKLTISELPEVKLPQNPSLGEIAGALDKEGDAIRGKIPPNSTLVALCVEGEPKTSEELSAFVEKWAQTPDKHLVFVIGGSYGLHPSLKAEARLRLSMSPMTFPHHLARVMVLEQIYRAFKISEGSSYHK
jgi:23S rRNA (pseudouridine1915-N3)-methyltransferase